jgi:hypothetical protein
MRSPTVVGLGMVLLLSGCIADAGDPEDDLDTDDAEATGTTLPLRFLPGELFVPSAAIRDEVREVFRTEAELEAVLAMDNPGIDFSREWGVFYAPGSTNDDLAAGSRARIDTVRVSSTGKTILVTTALEQNGEACPPRSTRPFLLVAVPIPDAEPALTRFYRADRVRDCAAAEYYDGVAFTAEQVAGALRACNAATSAELGAAGITGTQRALILDGRTWTTLSLVASTAGIGATTMTKLRDLAAAF